MQKGAGLPRRRIPSSARPYEPGGHGIAHRQADQRRVWRLGSEMAVEQLSTMTERTRSSFGSPLPKRIRTENMLLIPSTPASGERTKMPAMSRCAAKGKGPCILRWFYLLAIWFAPFLSPRFNHPLRFSIIGSLVLLFFAGMSSVTANALRRRSVGRSLRGQRSAE